VDLAGETVAIQTPTGLELRATADGHLLATISAPIASWRLATDGTYVTAASSFGLTAWSPAGAVLVTRSGDYSHAALFAAPDEIRVALGAAGNDVIEAIAVATGTTSVSAQFSGAFNSWFVDGERFFTNVGNTVWIYSKAAVQQELTTLPSIGNLTGQGNWFWIGGQAPNYNLAVYAVGGSTSAAANYSGVAIASGMTIGMLDPSSGHVTIVNLSGATPSSVDYTVPHAHLGAYAAGTGASWLVGGRYGVVLDGSTLSATPQYFGFGQALSIVGSSSRAVIATASGKILSFNASTKALETVIPFAASTVELSSDGSVLAAMATTIDYQYSLDRSVLIYSLPSGSTTYTFPDTYNSSTAYQFDVALSGSGTTLERLFISGAREVTGTSGSPTIWSDTAACCDLAPLSEDGSLIAEPVSGGANIFKNGSLTTAVPGVPAGWLMNNRLYVNLWGYPPGEGGGTYSWRGCAIYDDSGHQLGTCSLPELDHVRSITADTFYSPSTNAIYSISSNTATWTTSSPNRGIGAVAGEFVVFASGATIRAEPY